MTLLERIMRRFTWIPKTQRDETINESIEANADEHSRLVGALHLALRKRLETNGALRESIRIAKHRTNSFADFERMAIRREELK